MIITISLTKLTKKKFQLQIFRQPEAVLVIIIHDRHM